MPPYAFGYNPRKRRFSAAYNPVTKRVRVRRVKRVSSTERKGVTFAKTATVIPTAADLNLVNGIATGSDIDTRDGRQVSMTQITGQVYVYPNIAAAGPCAMHFYLVKDKSPNGALPSFSDIFDAATIPHVPRQDAKHRFTIMKSWSKHTTYDSVTGLNEMSPIYFDVKCAVNSKMFFKGVTSGIGSIDTGAIYFIGIATNANYTYQYKMLTEFTDV